MRTSKKSNKELIPDISKIEEIKHIEKRKLKKIERDDEIKTGPRTTRKEEKDPGEYPMKNV